jgi:hypothetical protein
MAWHRGELAAAEHLARRPPGNGTTAATDAVCDGIEPGVLAAARERYPTRRARWPPPKPPGSRCTPGPRFTANRGAAAIAASQAGMLGEGRYPGIEQGQQLTLDDAVAYAARKGGGLQTVRHWLGQRTPAERWRSPAWPRRPAERRHRPAAVHRPGHRQVHLSHLRQARHHHPALNWPHRQPRTT